ncbi:VWD domain-containing protein [Nannocystis pusilla]|uniref:VWD domain-containing protein n=1 Tax=Nannocystis pusilla TaxID=889268 RepID=UPI003BF2FE86
MPYRHHPLFISACTLAGLLGCEAPDPAPGPVPREVSLEEVVPEPAPPSCLDDLKLVLQHEDGTVDVTTSLAEGFGSLARPNDLVQLNYALAPGCAADHGGRVSLVAYTSPGVTPAVLTPKPPSRAFDMHTALNGAGGLLQVRLPPCAFEIDVALGEPVQTFAEPVNPYAAADRLIAAGLGGYGSCDAVPPLGVERFDPAEAGWGEAPVSAHFGWKLAADADAALTCALDLDGDGEAEQVLTPCVRDTDGIKTVALPSHTFAAVGEHRPSIVVSDGERRIWAATSIFANHLEYKPDVVFPEDAAGFVEAAVEPAQPPALATVKLRFASPGDVPAIAPGAVIVGKGGASGYMIRAEEVMTQGDTLVAIGVAVGLEDAVAGGFFGLRDVAIDTSKAGCGAGTCPGTVTPVPEAPGAAGGEAPGLLGVQADEEATLGVKVALDVMDGLGELEVFAGVFVERLVLHFGWFGLDRVDITGTPSGEITAAIKAEFESESPDFGEYVVGTLPTPVPLTVWMVPKATFAASMKALLKGSVRAPFSIVYDDAGWRTQVDPKINGESGPGSALEVEGEVKVEVAPEFELRLAFLQGPYAAPKLGLGLKATRDACEGCLTAFVDGGAEVGWHSDVWVGGDLFEPQEITLFEVELLKKCWEMPGIPELCEPDEDDPDPAPEGGSYADVHIVSHDGLLFDFQAGGEFVLTRATEGAPFEVQTRQEPFGEQLALSYNTALATVVDGHRVGLYTRMPSTLYVDGVPTELAIDQTLALGGGQIDRIDGSTYVIDYPGGEQVRARRAGTLNGDLRHFNIGVHLPESRAGAVEGLLGDADGDRANDIRTGPDTFIPHPVSFALLHGPGPGTFRAAWQVEPAASLFDYAAGTDPMTFRAPPYSLMPTAQLGTNGPHAALAQTACASCPILLREGCLLDVGHTGDAAFAEVCQTPLVDPVDLLPPSFDPILVGPTLPFEDCEEQVLVFRAPGAALADQYPGGEDFEIQVHGLESPPIPGFPPSWRLYQTFRTTDAPVGGSDWGEQFVCEPLGPSGWGECRLRIEPRGQACAGDLWIQHYRWSVKPLTGPGSMVQGYFTAP